MGHEVAGSDWREYSVLVGEDTIYQVMDSDGVRSVMNFRFDLLRSGVCSPASSFIL